MDDRAKTEGFTEGALPTASNIATAAGDATGIPVTQEMIAAGGKAAQANGILWSEVAMAAIYRAMRDADPDEKDRVNHLPSGSSMINALCDDVRAMREERDAARARLPPGMQNCTIRFLQCDVGHARLTAWNWVPHDCPYCAMVRLEQECANRLTAPEVNALLAAKDTRIAKLKTLLAGTPVAFEDIDAEPPTEPGFLTAIRRGNKAVVGMVTGPGDVPKVVE